VYAAAASSDQRGRISFTLCFLLALAGNLLLVLAADLVSFYVGFALMGLSAYGMIASRHSQRSRRAGRVYLVFTLVGELALFAAMVLLVASSDARLFSELAGEPLPPAAIVLLLIGFGIKLALPGLHMWLPLVYGSAPIAAVAVLSGPMMKAGLLGWLRFIPPESAGQGPWAEILLGLGAAGLLLGVLVGVVQRHPRAVLAYSSIAKMGVMAALFGAILAHPAQASGLMAALVLFAMHHLLVKSALFLGVGEWERRGTRPWLLVGMTLLALSMAGVTGTGGAAAKLVLGEALVSVGLALELLLWASALGTSVLMLRLMWLLLRRKAMPTRSAAVAASAWLGLLPLALWAPFWPDQTMADASTLTPLLVAGVVMVLAWLALRCCPVLRVRIPPGDVLHLLTHGLRASRGVRDYADDRLSGLMRFSLQPSSGSQAPPAALAGPGLLWLALFLLILVAVLWGG
jgi:formate hydrogenlyase subunit 3/multisubunit Na+/H+ antiporter MnhD subunit